MQGAIGCKCCIKVTNSRLATAQVDLTNRKYWAPWAPEDYWVGAHGAHGAQLGPIPDKKKVEKKNEKINKKNKRKNFKFGYQITTW